MVSDYLESVDEKKCSLSYFDNVLHSLNIGFESPQVDKCTYCEKHKVKENHECTNETCEYSKHRERSRIARENMISDSLQDTNKTKVVAVDMQKILLIPKLPTKDYFFSRKLILFNETFADINPKSGNSYCFLWTEDHSGRKAKNIATTYVEFVIRCARDYETIIFYMDNCNAQNKNKTLFTALSLLVNDKSVAAKAITLKYLEVGHTYMAADAVHAAITSKLNKQEYLYDKEDFVSLIERSQKKNKVITLEYNEMYEFESLFLASCPTFGLTDWKIVEFRKGSFSAFVKVDFKDEFQKISFMKRKSLQNFEKLLHDGVSPLESVAKQTEKLGIPKKKFDDLQKLTEQIPPRRRAFLQNLTVNDTVPDLTTDRDIDF